MVMLLIYYSGAILELSQRRQLAPGRADSARPRVEVR